MKYVSKNQNHKALIYYAINDHMYLVRDEYKASLAARAREENKINTSLLEGREKTNAFHDMDIIENIDFNDVEKYAKQSCVFMFSRNIHNINDIFHLFLSKYNLIPSVDKTHKTNILQFTHNNNGVIHIYAADPNEIKIITYKQVKYLCEQNDIEFKNQTYMQFVKQMKDNFYNAKMGRIKRTKEEREEILKRFNNVCNICKCNIKESYEIDHIRPLANGGKEEKSNLQPLCKACHRDKCSNEHENGDYIRIIDSESSFNNHIQSVMDSPLSQTHAFIEPIVDDVDESRKIFNIDINKCRKNILYYGNDDYCVFTVFDKVRKYKPRNSIKKGLYYVSSDNYMPLRGNGWYYHNMIKYCLDNGIITHDNIRYEIISSLSIPFDYYNEFIDHCYKNIDNYDIICEKLNMMVDEMKDYKKLAINGMIGGFKPNLNKRANWSSLCITNNSSEAFTNYVKNDGAFIHAFNVDDKKYFHALKQGYKTNLETEAPVYNQILQQEQIELHKLMMLVQANNGTVLDVNTDAVSCIFEGDKLPFQMLDDINIKGYYYDDKKMMPKYKIEDKGRLKSARLSNNIRKDHYIHDIQYKWNIIPDVNDNNFEPLVNKIFSSGESWFITGPGGAGKSHLINMIKERFKEVDVKEEETSSKKKDSVDIMRLKQEKEKINKILDKLKATKEDVNYKMEKCKARLSNKKKSKEEKAATKEKFNKLEKELNNINTKLDDNNKQIEDINKRMEDQNAVEDEADKIKSFVSLAPTNLAALIINGTTIHKFACLIRSYDILKSMKFKYVFLDEVSMLTEKFYKFLLMIKKLKPDVKFIISGDYNQLKAINDRISSETNYSKSPALFELCDFNKLELTTCRRANDELFNLIKFDNIPNLTPNHFKASSDVTSVNMHLAFTNKKRIEINKIMMKYKAKEYEGPEKLKLKKLLWDQQSQDLILIPNTPIICKVNNQENNLINNERFIITSIEENMITIKNDRQTLTFNAVEDNAFSRMFRVAYCSTCHSSQGMTINEPYMIHEFERYSQNMTYVALSRATEKSLINIYV
jgi:5-methylcytosine-specific restriction enzyme A